MEITSITNLETEAVFDGKVLKTHNCDLGDWYGDETCTTLDISREIENIGLPQGKYKIVVTFERIAD